MAKERSEEREATNMNLLEVLSSGSEERLSRQNFIPVTSMVYNFRPRMVSGLGCLETGLPTKFLRNSISTKKV